MSVEVRHECTYEQGLAQDRMRGHLGMCSHQQRCKKAEHMLGAPVIISVLVTHSCYARLHSALCTRLSGLQHARLVPASQWMLVGAALAEQQRNMQCTSRP